MQEINAVTLPITSSIHITQVTESSSLYVCSNNYPFYLNNIITRVTVSITDVLYVSSIHYVCI